MTCGTGLMYRKRVCLHSENGTRASQIPAQIQCEGEATIEDSCLKAPCADSKFLDRQLIRLYLVQNV